MAGERFSYVLALISVGLVTLGTVLAQSALGLASSALIFLLPVLLVSPRGGVAPGLVAAIVGALAYNYFLLPPRFTLRIHGLENIVTFCALIGVALVTSRLATALKTREVEAQRRAESAAQLARFTALLGSEQGKDEVLAWLAAQFGDARIMSAAGRGEPVAGFSALDLSAAAWSIHNGDVTGHGTTIMPAADWSFVPLAPKGHGDGDVLALSRPKDGATRPASALDDAQEFGRLLGQALDRRALIEAREERERLEHRDTLRRTFLSSVAHDFRTPLTVVIGELTRLSNKDVDAQNALEQARRLDRMMEDVIGAARLESGRLTVQREAVDLIDSVAEARAALEGIIASISYQEEIADDLPLIDVDPILFRQILVNLLDNAVRHATYRVTLGATVENDAVCVAIDDDGPGIAVADQMRIFESFERAEGSDRRGGSGLGLAIVKGFADAMDIRVSVGDRSGGGARFELTIPQRA